MQDFWDNSVSLSNEKYEIQPTSINLYANEYSQELHYYLFAVKSDKCIGSCNTLHDLFNKGYVPNKTENLNILVFDIATGKKWIKNFNKRYIKRIKGIFDGM